MDSVIEGTVSLMYINHGVSKEKKTPYLMLSNGRKEVMIFNLERDIMSQFDGLKPEDIVELEVQVRVGQEDFNVLSVVK